MNELGLGIEFVARDRATPVIERVRGGVQRVRGEATTAGAAMQAAIGTGVATGIVAGLVKVADAASKFELGLAKVKNISSATAEDMAILRDAAYEAALRTQFSPAEVVEGLEQLASAGFKASEQVGLLNQSLVLAQAGQISMSKATSTVATAVKLFGLAGQDQAVMTDKMLKTIDAFKLQAIDLENALAKTSGAVLTTNQSFDEMLIAVGLIKNVFPHAGESGNSVSRAMAGIANKSKLLKKELGINVVDTITGKVRPALDLFIELEERSAERFTDAAERAQFLDKVLGAFGKKGVAAAIGSLREEANKTGRTMKEVAADFRKTIAGAQGTSDKWMETLLATFPGQIKILVGAVQTITTAIGEPLIQILQPVVKAIAEATTSVARFIRDIPMGVKKTIGTIALLVGGFTVLAFGAAAVVAIMTAFGGAFLAALGAVVPVIAAVGAATAVIVGFVKAVRANLGGIGDRFRSIFEDVKLLYQGLVQLFSDGAFSGAVMREMNSAGNEGVKQLAVNIFAVWHRFKAFFSGIKAGWDSMSDTVNEAFAVLGNAFRSLADEFGMLATSVTGAADDMPTDSFTSFGKTVGSVLARVVSIVVRGVGILVAAYAGVVRGIRKVFEQTRGVFEAFWSAIKGLLEQLGGAVGVVDGELAAGGDTIAGFGEIAGKTFMTVIAVITRVATVVIKAITLVIRIFNALSGVVEFVGDVIRGVFDGILTAINPVIGGIAKVTEASTSIGGILGYLPPVAAYNYFVGEDEEEQPKVGRAQSRIRRISAGTDPEVAARQIGGISGRASVQGTDMAALEKLLQDININLKVDGDVLATTIARVERDVAGRRFEARPLEP